MKSKKPKPRRKKEPSPDDRCWRCGYARHEHALVNYADGPFVGLDYLVCPIAIFKSDVSR